MPQKDYNFTVNDLEKLKASLEKRKEEVEIWREYALKRKKKSVLERLRREISAIEEFKTFGDVNGYLELLNRGEFKFLPGDVFFLVNPYFGKVRLTYRFPEPKEQNREAALKFYKNKWTAKLTAAKLKEFFRDKEEREQRRYLQRNRMVVIRDLVRALDGISKSGKRFKILRGDFKDYTLNIPRRRLFKELERLEVPPHLRSLVKNFFAAGNRFSINLKGYPVEEFFGKNFRGEFLRDTNFRAQLNLDGVVPGSPLSNLMGQLFLVDFDRMMEELAGDEGFYARFLDDFVLILPADRLSEGELRERIESFILDKYGEHPLIKFDRKAVGEIVKLETLRDLPTDFDFLGYTFEAKDGGFKRGIRYKTLKKFVQKYLHEYRFRPSKETKREDLVKHLSAKSAYLYRWVYNFLEVNDKKLLDRLFVDFILPDLYQTVYNYLKVKHGELSSKRIKERTRMEVKKLKNFFKPTLIHRLLKKECARAAKEGVDCEERLKKLVKETGKKIEESLTVK